MKCLELFSGMGGLALGLERAGFRHVKFVEMNKHACATLRANFPPELVYEGDVRHFDFSSVGQIDIIAGGPPCQPFSLGGKGNASNDARDMFPYACKAVESLLPRAFIFENVKGLLRPAFAEYFNSIIARLEKAGYNVSYTLANAADYGVPQKRERIFIVGIRKDIKKRFVFPVPTHPKHAWKTIRDVLGSPEPSSQIAKQYAGHTGSRLDAPAKTIKAGVHGVPGGENMIVLDNGQTRYLTVDEAKKLQTFPDDFEVAGSWGEAMRQIGNAVPVLLAGIIGNAVYKTIQPSTRQARFAPQHIARRCDGVTGLVRNKGVAQL
ncbi:MAG: DNA cytosine methyltransferase [Kiritimatiellaeota bacterium]|nr:DNA cytosine methyltransferase [Kiritimatiellota bacterium]